MRERAAPQDCRGVGNRIVQHWRALRPVGCHGTHTLRLNDWGALSRRRIPATVRRVMPPIPYPAAPSRRAVTPHPPGTALPGLDACCRVSGLWLELRGPASALLRVR